MVYVVQPSFVLALRSTVTCSDLEEVAGTNHSGCQCLRRLRCSYHCVQIVCTAIDAIRSVNIVSSATNPSFRTVSLMLSSSSQSTVAEELGNRDCSSFLVSARLNPNRVGQRGLHQRFMMQFGAFDSFFQIDRSKPVLWLKPCDELNVFCVFEIIFSSTLQIHCSKIQTLDVHVQAGAKFHTAEEGKKGRKKTLHPVSMCYFSLVW